MHEILHIWNQGVREMVEVCHMKTWAATCASQQWKFAGYIMSLPCERWVRSNGALATYWKRTRGTPSKEYKQI